MNIEKVIQALALCPESPRSHELEFLSHTLRTVGREPVTKGKKFGLWRLSFTKPHSIDYCGGGYRTSPYWVSFERCANEEGFAHWIAHLQQKSWGACEMANFMRGVLTYQQLKKPSRKKAL